MPHNIALLAEACEIAGEIDEARIVLDDALQNVETTGERWFAAELTGKKASCCCGKGIPRPPRNSIARP